VKYPRTPHLPWSPGYTADDAVLQNDAAFDTEQVVVTLKLDGENTSMYADYVHARSLSYDPHPSRSFIRALHGRIANDIPLGWRLCGENVTAVHSIRYDDLPAHFLLFSVWDANNLCLSWADTVDWAQLLDLELVPVIYQGPYDRLTIEARFAPYRAQHEGYVVRWAKAFGYDAFRHAVGKWVREDHVQTTEHWRHRQVRIQLRRQAGRQPMSDSENVTSLAGPTMPNITLDPAAMLRVQYETADGESDIEMVVFKCAYTPVHRPNSTAVGILLKWDPENQAPVERYVCPTSRIKQLVLPPARLKLVRPYP